MRTKAAQEVRVRRDAAGPGRKAEDEAVPAAAQVPPTKALMRPRRRRRPGSRERGRGVSREDAHAAWGRGHRGGRGCGDVTGEGVGRAWLRSNCSLDSQIKAGRCSPALEVGVAFARIQQALKPLSQKRPTCSSLKN